MKLEEYRNDTGKRLTFRNVLDIDGKILAIDAGAVKPLASATVEHPAVKPYVGNGLNLVKDDQPKTKPKAVAPRPPEPKEITPEPPEEGNATEPEEPADPTEGDMRETYVRAPGITEDNVDDILALFPSPADIAVASKSDLTDAGVSKAYVKRLQAWAEKH